MPKSEKHPEPIPRMDTDDEVAHAFKECSAALARLTPVGRVRVLGGLQGAALRPGGTPETVEWTRRDPVDGDPSWRARMDGLDLRVSVPIGCSWFWEWSIYTDAPDSIEAARGDLYVGEYDADEDEWDYQHVELAQKRCVAVARAILKENAA